MTTFVQADDRGSAPLDTISARAPSVRIACLSYGLGDMAINLIWGAVMGYLMYFYTEVCLLSPAKIGVIMLTARLIGVGGDLLIGAAVDRRPDGLRALPFLRYGSLPFALFFLLTFVPLEGDAHAWQFWWSLITYTGLTLSYAVISTPYSVLINLVTDDSRFRARLATSRMIGCSTGIIIASAGLLPLADLLAPGNRQIGVPLSVAVGAVITWLSLRATYRHCPERITGHIGRVSLLTTLQALLHNRRWAIVTLSMATNIFGITFLFGAVIYYSHYVLGLPDRYGGLLLFLMNGGILIGSAAITPAMERWSLHVCLGLTGTLSALPLFAGLVLAPTTANAITLLLLNGVFIGAWSSCSYAILAEAADKGGEVKGKALGVPFALNVASTKLAISLGGYLLALLLAHGGFESGQGAQSVPARMAIASACFLVPAIAFLVSGLVAIFYPTAKERAA